MFNLLKLTTSKIRRQNLNVPGTALTVRALIYNGIAHYCVADVIGGIAVKQKSPTISAAYPPLHKVIRGSKNGTGTVIISKRGVYADTSALRCLISTFFWDIKHSVEYTLIQEMMRAMSGHKQPTIRTIGNSDLYAKVMELPAPTADFAKATKQLTDSDFVRISDYSFDGFGDLNIVPYTEPEEEDEEDEEKPAQVYYDPALRENTEGEGTKERIKLNELTVADFIQLAKQLLTTREVTLTISVK